MNHPLDARVSVRFQQLGLFRALHGQYHLSFLQIDSEAGCFNQVKELTKLAKARFKLVGCVKNITNMKIVSKQVERIQNPGTKCGKTLCHEPPHSDAPKDGSTGTALSNSHSSGYCVHEGVSLRNVVRASVPTLNQL